MNKVYVGTLWYDSKSEKIIEQHRNRRDKHWNLVESNGDILDDISRISDELLKISRPAACMIDGITTWIFHCGMKSGDLLTSARELADRLTELFLFHDDILWRLIDVRPKDINGEMNQLLGHTCAMIHRVLKRHLTTLEIQFHPTI